MRSTVLRAGNQIRRAGIRALSPCSDHHQFKMEEPGKCGIIEKRLLSNFLKCSCWAPIGRPDIPWSLNNVARAVTKCTRLVADAWPVSFLTFVTLLKVVDGHCFNTLILLQILWRLSKSQGGTLFIFGSRTFVSNMVELQEAKRQWQTIPQNPK